MQAEGRTPIAATGARRQVVLLALLLIAVDQITKAIAVEMLEGRGTVSLIGAWLQLQLVRNPGAAFSLGTSTTYVFTAIATIAVFLIIRYAPRIIHRSWRIALGLVLAGAAGNLIDRLVRDPGFPGGHVVDFVKLPMWPIFNVADTAITFAVLLAMFLTIRGIEPDR